MNTMNEIIEYINNNFIYLNGSFYRIKHNGNNQKIGSLVGGVNGSGYIQTKIFGRKFKCHRLIWLLFNGEIPNGYEIDHINGNRSDNRLENLRLATRRQNQQNRVEHRNDHLVGTTYCKKENKWYSHITINGKTKHIGIFETKELAHETYLKELEKLNEN